MQFRGIYLDTNKIISACATGSYGCNCSVRCLDNTYGQGCYHVCNCSADEYCDPVEGCTINGSTINQTKGNIVF